MSSNAQQTVWIARHGTRIDMVDPQWKATAERPFDPHLAEQGLDEAERLGRRLAGEPIDIVYSSPFLRAIQTATPVARAAGVPLRIEPGICEWLREEWFTCVPELIPQVDLGWNCEHTDSTYCSPVELCYPESWEQVSARAGQTALRLVESGANLVLVGHGATVIGVVSALLEQEAVNTPPAPPACLFKLVRRDGKWHCELAADTAHLNGHAG